jgi:hypothetical protein
MSNASRLARLGFVLLFIAAPAFATQGAHGPSEGVLPTIVHPASNSGNATPNHTFSAPLGFQTSAGHVEDLKLFGPTNQTLGGREIMYDTNTGTGTGPLAASMGTNFQGMLQNGWIPYDGAIAVGATQVVVMTNSQFAVYNKTTGAQTYITQFDPFFGNAAGGGFDPKCFYDAAAGRFVLMVVEQTTTGSLALIDIAVSQTSDATGAYYKYSFDATVTGTTETNTWSDYPSLGYDDNNIYVGSNQYSFSNSFQFAKVRAWSKAQLYAGGAASYVDFANIKIADGTNAFTVKAGRNLSASAIGHFLATKSSGGNLVTKWTISGSFPSLTMSAPQAVSIGTYAVEPNAKQPGSGQLVATGDNRTQDVVWQAGNYYTAFAERAGTNRKSYVSAIRYLQISDAGTAIRDITYTASGIFMYYPAVSVDPAGNAAIVFERSSGTEYASVYQTRLPAGGSMDASKIVKAGVAANTSGRWGDYDGVANDPSNSNVVWVYGGWANTSNRWATWIAALTPSVFSAATAPQPIYMAAAVRGATTSGGLEVSPNPFNPSTKIDFVMPRGGRASLRVYDVQGRMVSRLVDGNLPAGPQSYRLDAAGLPSGIYLIRLSAAGRVETRRVTLLK